MCSSSMSMESCPNRFGPVNTMITAIADLAGRPKQFDTLLLNDARESGADVHEDPRDACHFRRHPRESRSDGVRRMAKDAMCLQRLLIDASGQSSVLLDRFGLRESDLFSKGCALVYSKG